jgi:hypothetical protein
MAHTARMRPITEAEIKVAPWKDRAAVLAETGVRIRPTLRSVETSAIDPSHYADKGVMVAMYAKLGCETKISRVGSVMATESVRYPMATVADSVSS